MKNIFYLVLITTVYSFCSCQKGPYPYINIKAVKGIDSVNHPGVNNAAFIYNNNVYFLSNFDAPATQITTDGSASKFVKISHDHTKFAYQGFGGSIIIVDNKGVNITTLTQYTQVKSFDWSADDKTLYILNNDAMYYYGPSLNLPEITFPGIINGSTMEVLSASVSMKGDFAYVIHGYNFLDGDKYKLIIKPANNGAMIEFDDNDVPYAMDYVSFSSNKQDLVLGYRDRSSGGDSQEKVSFFTNLSAYPDFSYGENGNGLYCSPVYNSDLNYFVTGLVISTDVSGAAKSAPAAIFLKSDTTNNKTLIKYSAPTNSIYTDWK